MALTNNVALHPMQTPEGTMSSVHTISDSSQHATIQRFEWDTESLLPYRKYPELRAERQSSAPHSRKPLRGNFTDLPAEIRNAIYRLVLVPDPGYVELSPKSTRYDISNGRAQVHHNKKYEREMKPALGLLRANKQINNEATPIYYGETEIRFSSNKGWYILDAFLRSIGRKPPALIRKVAIHVPWSGRTNDYYKDNLPESKGTLRHIDQIINKINLRPSSLKEILRIRRAICTLERHGSLKSFRLILPDTFDLVQRRGSEDGPRAVKFPYGQYSVVLKPAKFKDLKIELVSLRGGAVVRSGSEYESVQWTRDLRARTLRGHLAARQEFRRAGYVVSDVAYDELGYWPVEPNDDGEIPQIVGED